jgi:signal transduction histidine kinase
MSVAAAFAITFAALALVLAWRLAVVRADCAARLARMREDARAEAQVLGEQSAATERQRIYDDLHDDLGAKLLELVYRAETPEMADRARAALQDLRDVVTRSRGTPGTLDEVLADIREEAQQRLAVAGIALAWEVAELPDAVVLPPARALHLYRIVREAVTNAIRHARAQRMRVRVRVGSDAVQLELTDDGTGEALDAAATAGTGMRAMRERAARLAGAIEWKAGTEGGTKVLLSVPLRDALP